MSLFLSTKLGLKLGLGCTRYGHFEFLKVLEVQKKGRPHLLILIAGISHIPIEDLSAIWQKYGGGYAWIRSVEKRIDAVSYVLKYVNKTILGENETYAALLFADSCHSP